MDSVPDVAARAAASQAAPVPQPVSPQAFTTQVQPLLHRETSMACPDDRHQHTSLV